MNKEKAGKGGEKRRKREEKEQKCLATHILVSGCLKVT